MFEKIYNFLAFEITPPKSFGWFHLFSLASVLFLTIIICKKCKSSSERTERLIAFWIFAALIALEAYKQFVYAFIRTDEGIVFDYSWHGFPFQLCSSPLYVLPFIAFLPSGKLREAFAAFYGSFVLLGGLAVCIYPGNVLVETLGINFHTMFWHGSQVSLGVYFNLRRFSSKNPPRLKGYFLSAFFVFLSFVVIAMLLNEGFYYFFTQRGYDDTFNMFFISRHFECIFPVLDWIQAHTPHPVFLLSYVVILSVFSFILILSEKLIIDKISKNKTKKSN